MRIESDGHSQGNPRLFELVEHAPKTGKSPTVWAWPELMDYLKIAGQPVSGPWPPHQEPRPDPEAESGPVAVPDPEAPRAAPKHSASRKPSASAARKRRVPIAARKPPACRSTRWTPTLTPAWAANLPPTRPDPRLSAEERTVKDLMYPSRFRYEAPRSLNEAIALLRDGGDDAKVMAGGQSLVPLMKLRFASPELIVDINNVPGLAYHRQDPDGSLHVGALCRHAELERSALLESTQPTMAAAAPLIADPLVRNRGTLVGSLCHADPQGDWASVTMALGGSVVAQGPGGRRIIPVADFVTGPFQNVLDPAEIAIEAVIPAAQGTRSGGYLKLERRVGDFATVGVAVAVETSGNVVTRAGIALTGVGGATIAATEAQQALVGQPLSAQTIEMAAALAAGAARPKTDHRGSAEYKRHMVHTFVTRILSRTEPVAERAA